MIILKIFKDNTYILFTCMTACESVFQSYIKMLVRGLNIASITSIIYEIIIVLVQLTLQISGLSDYLLNNRHVGIYTLPSDISIDSECE